MKLRGGAATAVLVLVAALGFAVIPMPAHAASLPSGVGDQNVSWIVVSPAYQRTGLVVAVAAPLSGCQSNCMKLWITHSGGASWATASAAGWDGGRPVITVDGSGREVLFAASGTALQRSDDDGQTWSTVASGGGVLPSPSPQFASDHAVAVAVAGGQDYVLRGTSSQPVTGSGKTLDDLSFMYSPAFPSAGSHAPVLLAAADNTSAHNPVIQRCTAALACSGGATLPGSTSFSAPETLVPSTDYANDGVVFAQSGRGIYKSTDGAGTFTPLTVLSANGAAGTATPMLALAPGYREAGPVRSAFVAVFQTFTDQKNPHTAGGVYRTGDGGATWSRVGSPSPLDGGADAVAVAPDGRLFAGYLEQAGQQASGGLLCSTNGNTWQATCPALGQAAGTGTSGGGGHGPGSTPCSGASCSAAATAQAATGASGAAVTPSSTAAGGSAGGVAAATAQIGTSTKGGGNAAPLVIGIVAGLLVLALGGFLLRRHASRRGPA